jgi:hypothetical protein
VTDETLEAYAASIKELDEAKHTHENKDVLDGLTQEMLDDAHKHENMDVLEKLTQEVIDDAHEHENKEVVDKLTQEVLDDAHKHDNSDVLDKLGESDDGNLLFDGKEIQGGGGGGNVTVLPKNPTNISVKPEDGGLVVYWTDPEDNVIDGTVFARWGGTMLIYNADHAPADENDGIVVVNNTTRDAYATDGIEITGLTNNEKYYLYLIPYTTDGTKRYDDDNRRVGRPAQAALNNVRDIKMSADDKSVTVIWENPDESKTVNGVTATWAKTIVVLKADSAPTDETDGYIYESTDYAEYSHTFEAENGHDYYVAFFVVSDLGSVTETDTDITTSTYATLTVTTAETDLYGQILTVTWTDEEEEKQLTGSFNVMGFCQFKVPFRGDVVASASYEEKIADGLVRITSWEAYGLDLNYNPLKPLNIITWAQFARVLRSYYLGDIMVDDVKEVWSVGDTIDIELAEMAATGVGEKHVAQTQTFAIYDFEHDTLATTVGVRTKALVTFGQVKVLSNGTAMEGGYMNSTNTNANGWDGTARRAWCNNVYLNALPEEVRKLIKVVLKQNYRVNSETTLTTTEDSVFIPSETETFGAKTYSAGATEGTQYEYLKTAANRIKKAGNADVTGAAVNHWERSPAASNATYFCCVNASGAAYGNNASNAYGLAPCFCF